MAETTPDAARVMESAPGARVVIDGRERLYFAGCGYLGLQGRPEVIAAMRDAAERYGVAAATSRTAYGATPPLLAVERRAAEWLEAETAYYFPSAYAGNRILVDAVVDRFDRAYLDEAAHPSLRDAAERLPCPPIVFAHRDPDDLAARLAEAPSGERPLVLTDGVFAASGRLAPIDAYRKILRAKSGAGLLVDDAHGMGALGSHGRGTYEHFGVDLSSVNCLDDAEDVACFVATTMSKAVGGYGGLIPCSRSLLARIEERCPQYAGASPIPTPVAAATHVALGLVMNERSLRERLETNALRLKDGLRRLGLAVDDSPTPIVSLSTGDSQQMRCIQAALAERDIIIAYFAKYAGLPPTGALRIAVFATHSPDMIDGLLDALAAVL